MKITVIIPSLNPDNKLIQVVDGLIDKGFEDIVIVNDGSDKEHGEPFQVVSKRKQCHILHHDVNKGKGRALKTAFQYCIDNRPDIEGVVTVDGDNQHSAKDIYACAEEMLKHKKHMVLGVRDFSGDDVPAKSKFGNNITRFVFRTACGLKVSDTQTGLRAIPSKYLEFLVGIKGERFEYETNMLLEFKHCNIDISEVKINTIYIEENASTHFKPIRDSIKIYGVIFKFLFSSLMSSAIDIAVFSMINILLGNMAAAGRIFIATAIARLISSMFNYTFNRKAVFKSDTSIKKSMSRYYVLCVCQMVASYGLVWGITELLGLGKVLTTTIKIIIDTCLFFISYKLQRIWVFK